MRAMPVFVDSIPYRRAFGNRFSLFFSRKQCLFFASRGAVSIGACLRAGVLRLPDSDAVGQSGKGGGIQTFAPDIRAMPTVRDDTGQHILGDVREPGRQCVGKRLAPLLKSQPDGVKEQLLVGGTDGGNTACILHNANMLAAMQPDFPIIVAGNRSAARQCERILAGCRVRVCENVMPKFGLLKTEQTQAAIREIFLSRIIQAKGLDRAAERMNDILMPTPAAVLKALELLSGGFGGEPGIGELAAVDVGGATTDVYSICEGMPRQMNTVYKGLPEPYAKRTVEGDIGMRYSVLGILDAVGARRLAELSGLPEQRVQTLCRMLSEQTELVPDCDGELAQLDHALACMAVSTAAKRHAGTIEETYTLLGQTFVQAGKDLTAVRRVVATGGSLIHSPRVREIASYFCYDPADPASLRPKNAEILIDSSYILAAMGLLSTHDPLAALQIMKRMIR